jgi:hypothetical protein
MYRPPLVLAQLSTQSEGEGGGEGDGEGEAARGGALAGIRITHVVSQSDMLRFLHRHSAALGPVMGQTLEALGLAFKPVVCVPEAMSAIHAFATMQVSVFRGNRGKRGKRRAGGPTQRTLHRRVCAAAPPTRTHLPSPVCSPTHHRPPPPPPPPPPPLPPLPPRRRRPCLPWA